MKKWKPEEDEVKNLRQELIALFNKHEIYNYVAVYNNLKIGIYATHSSNMRYDEALGLLSIAQIHIGKRISSEGIAFIKENQKQAQEAVKKTKKILKGRNG